MKLKNHSEAGPVSGANGVKGENVSAIDALESRCGKCWKTAPLCLCDSIKPAKSPIRILVLQHPSEAKNLLGTARILSLSTIGTVHVIGHTWRSLGHALNAPKDRPIPLKDWAVLFVGSKKNAAANKDAKPFSISTRSGEPLKKSEIAALKGIILLDGNWSQSKTLWWRNAWLLRHPRIVLNPPTPSGYHRIRRQPRRNYLSTIEAAAFCVENISPQSPLPELLRKTFQEFLVRCEQATPKAAPSTKNGSRPTKPLAQVSLEPPALLV